MDFRALSCRNFCGSGDSLIQSSILLFIKWIPVAGNSSRIGNGYCDDENNNDECNFDGGDCCLDIVLTDYCTKCQCLEG